LILNGHASYFYFLESRNLVKNKAILPDDLTNKHDKKHKTIQNAKMQDWYFSI